MFEIPQRYTTLCRASFCWVLVSVFSLLVGCGATSSRENGSQQPLNIVWIIADDLSPDLAFNGNAAVSTPNLDRLAAEGVYFNQAYATAPVCSASRSGLITGMYPSSIGAQSHRLTKVDKKPLPEGVKTLPDYMKAQGYFVTNGNADMSGFGKTDYNFLAGKKLFDGKSWEARAEGQPFFAQVQIYEPHRDFHQNQDPSRPAKIELPPYEIDHAITRADWANYMASIEVLDAKVGAILDRLEQQGLADNTVVFFFGDHGRPHIRDKQWLYDGGLRVPLIVRWPGKLKAGTVDERPVSLIDVGATSLALSGVALPASMHGENMLSDDFSGREFIFGARDRSGNVVDRVRSVQQGSVKLIRNYFPEKAYMQGEQESYYKRLQYPTHTLTLLMHEQGALTEAQARIMATERPPEELYDLAKDPFELQNKIDDPAYAVQLAALRHALDDWVKQTDGAGYYQYIPRDQNPMAKRSEAWGKANLKKRGIETNEQREQELQWWQQELRLAP